MIFLRRRSLRLPALTVCVGLLLTGCASDPEDDEDQDTGAESAEEQQLAENPIPEPEYDDDDSVRLPVALVSPAGVDATAPIDEEGNVQEQPPAEPGGLEPHRTERARSELFGCDNRVSVVQTVPVVTEDPAHDAIEYLAALENYELGRPAFANAVGVASGIEVDSVDYANDVVTVNLTGQPQARNYCESWQALKQIEITARSATGAGAAEILVDGTPLPELWGLTEDAPLELVEIQR